MTRCLRHLAPVLVLVMIFVQVAAAALPLAQPTGPCGDCDRPGVVHGHDCCGSAQRIGDSAGACAGCDASCAHAAIALPHSGLPMAAVTASSEVIPYASATVPLPPRNRRERPPAPRRS